MCCEASGCGGPRELSFLSPLRCHSLSLFLSFSHFLSFPSSLPFLSMPFLSLPFVSFPLPFPCLCLSFSFPFPSLSFSFSFLFLVLVAQIAVLAPLLVLGALPALRTPARIPRTAARCTARPNQEQPETARTGPQRRPPNAAPANKTHATIAHSCTRHEKPPYTVQLLTLTDTYPFLTLGEHFPQSGTSILELP